MKIQIGQEDNYKEWKDKNMSDPYSACCFAFAEAWADLMEVEIINGHTVEQIAQSAADKADKKYGITGFMYNMAVQILGRCWAHGEALRCWHNREVAPERAEEVNTKPGAYFNSCILTAK